MGFLNILGYIGAGLAATFMLLGIIRLMSRPKETVIYEDDIIEQRGSVRWAKALRVSVVLVCVFAALLMLNLTDCSIVSAVGLSALGGIILLILLRIFAKADRVARFFTILNCVLSGASFAILISVWGWF